MIREFVFGTVWKGDGGVGWRNCLVEEKVGEAGDSPLVVLPNMYDFACGKVVRGALVPYRAPPAPHKSKIGKVDF